MVQNTKKINYTYIIIFLVSIIISLYLKIKSLKYKSPHDASIPKSQSQDTTIGDDEKIKSWYNIIPFYIDNSIPASINTYNLSNIKEINIPTGNPKNYNACIIGDRLFFRSVKNIGEDNIMTCMLDKVNIDNEIDFKYVKDSLKVIKLTSSFPNNLHVEDPRVIIHKNNYFLSYTDGYKMAVAKLDLDCNTIYSHYLEKPPQIKFEGGDGREKNWLPISMGNQIHFWYGDNPRTFLRYEDMETKLKFISVFKTNQKVKSNFGNIRGGCSPIEYKDGTQIWFFHTSYNGKYRIGAYITREYQVIAITPNPILTGNNIIFPCGVIKKNDDYYISMGINDVSIGFLKVSDNIIFNSI